MPTLRSMVCNDPPEGRGMCCVNGFLTIEDIRMKAKPEGRLTPTHLHRITGHVTGACNNTLIKWRAGKIKCEKAYGCVLVKTGLKPEDIPQWSPEHLAFLKLHGTSVLVDKVRTILEPRAPEQIRGRIIAQSQTDWLWIGISLDYVPNDLYLGDQLQVAPNLWGTVTSIDGPIVYLLLPGDKHKLKNKRLAMGGKEPSHLKPTPGLDKRGLED